VSDDVVPVSGRTGPIRVGVSPGVVPIVPGAESAVAIEVANDDNIIRSVQVNILGLDPAWVTLPPAGVALFPGETATIDLRCRLPLEFPSGARRAAIEVRDSIGDLVPAIVEFDLLVEPVEQLQLRVEPTNINAGRRGTFTATITNHGNSPVEAVVRAADPELLVVTTFVPAIVPVLPNAVGVARAEVRGKRPWFGPPAVRLLTVGVAPQPAGAPLVDPLAPENATAPGVSTMLVAVVQRPRFSRRLMTLVGLLLAATVFTVVLAATFAHLADQSKANAALLKESLGGNEAANGTGAASAAMSGSVTSSTGSPLAGVAVGLYDKGRGPSVVVAQTVTDGNGAYSLPSVRAGTYRVKFSAAGFADVWYDGAASFEEGKDVVMAGAPQEAINAQLVGQPAGVTGSVVGDDILGATVVVQIPAAKVAPVPDIPTTTTTAPAAGSAASTAADAGPVVQTVAVDSAGKFSIAGLPTPSSYVLTASKPGFVSRPRVIDVQPGDAVTDIVLELLRGDGKITGTVTDSSGAPIPGATVVASDGTNTASTVTLSATDASGAGAGTFELLNLITPGTFSMSVSADGFLTTNVTVRLDQGVEAPPQTIVLRPSTGTAGGTVSSSGPIPGPFGGVTVTVTGPDFTRTTTSLTTDPVGTWMVTGVPLPGTYTVTFSAAGYSTQAVGVDLSPANPQQTAINATLAPATASVSGRTVEAATGVPIAGVTVTLTGQGQTRTARTADDPLGAYGFSDLPPGAYTITFQRTGSPDLTLALTLASGTNPQPDARIEAPSGIYGQVRVNGEPFAGAELRIYLLSPTGPAYPFNPPTAIAMSDAQGNYSAVGIPAGQYLVDLYVNGQIQPPSKQAAVTPGTPTEHVDFDLTTAPPSTAAPISVATTAPSTTSTTSTTTSTSTAAQTSLG
jgi:hypothetical protein